VPLCLSCTTGGGGGNSGAASAERGQLQELLQLLRKSDLLPVAVFTFSKKRCDIAADACSGLDLTTSAEKHTIHTFIQSVLSRLKEGDRDLPQVSWGCGVVCVCGGGGCQEGWGRAGRGRGLAGLCGGGGGGGGGGCNSVGLAESNKRCDKAADACSGVDLTSPADKHTIHTFIQSVLSRLKEGDRDLPQVGQYVARV
jgi:superfamily II RNA helicase